MATVEKDIWRVTDLWLMEWAVAIAGTVNNILMSICIFFDHSIAEVKYLKAAGCHAAMADDALDVNKINEMPEGKQRMKDTQYD